jgi:hypothetical protein
MSTSYFASYNHITSFGCTFMHLYHISCQSELQSAVPLVDALALPFSLVSDVSTPSLLFGESSVASELILAGSSGGGGVFDFGGAEAGDASGSSGVATGGTTTPVGAEESTTFVAGAEAGISTTTGAAGSCPGRARRAAMDPSVIAFMYMSATSSQ